MASEAASSDTGNAGATVGIIIPPPEIRNIVDKTASFVAKNGWDFAERIRKEKEGEVKFNFLNPQDPYHVYFRHCVEQIREGKAVGGEEEAPEEEEEEKIAVIVEDEEFPLDLPPPEPEYITDPPSIASQDLDIVKLTAQFVALNGRSFMNSLGKREERNYLFDFLKPHHTLFHYFTNLVDQYSKILLPKDEVLEGLEADANDKWRILKRVKYAAKWRKHQEQEQTRMHEAVEAEKVAFQQINWHDFAVVQTLEFTESDKELPPPVSGVEGLGLRLIEMEKFQRQQEERAKVPKDANDMDVEMDIDDDKPAKPAAPVAPTVINPVPSEVKIRDYDPKQKGGQNKGEQYLISPLTGEKIPASKYQEHMRVGLLDPKWREQKEKAQAEKEKSQAQWSLGTAGAMDNLKEMASRRQDIFGHGDIETELGHKGDKEKSRLDSEASMIAQQNIVAKLTAGDSKEPEKPPAPSQQQQQYHHHQQQQQQQQQQRAPPQPVQSGYPPNHRPPFGNPQMQPPPHMMGHMHRPPMGQPLMQQPPHMGGHMGQPQHMQQQQQQQQPMQHRPPQQQFQATPTQQPINAAPPVQKPNVRTSSTFMVSEPAPKRTKTSAVMQQLQDEQAFLASHSGSVTVTVIVSESDDRFNLTQGQSIPVTLLYTNTINDLKNGVKDSIGMPPGKQKMQISDLALANTKTLAFYNITDGAHVSLSVKERGGKKR